MSRATSPPMHTPAPARSITGAVHIERYTGQLDLMRTEAGAVLKAGDETGDPMLRGWGNQGTAFAERLSGELDAATERIETALSIYRPVPSYGSIAEATADLAACHLARGRLDEAVDRYREAVGVLDAHALRNFEGAAPRTGLAEALYLRAEAGGDGPARQADLDEADGAASLAVKHAKSFKAGVANAARVSGIGRWLRGDESGARTWWSRGLDAGRSSGARYDEARILLELGRRAGDTDAQSGGERIMSDIVASWRAGA